MVGQTMQEQASEFRTATELRLQTMKGDFKVFAERTLPFELQLLVKRWFEQQTPRIEHFLGEFSTVVAQEYGEHFGTTFGYVGDRLAGGATLDGDGRSLTAEDPNEYIGLALPAAGYIAAAFLATGPFVIVGLVAGGLLGKRLRDMQVETIRQQLLAELPAVIEEVTARPVEMLYQAIDTWFAGMLSALDQQFQSDLLSRRRDLVVDVDPENPDAVAERLGVIQSLQLTA
jgi:hypothetical protein